jgi:ferritin-like metal-binding protein YciE
MSHSSNSKVQEIYLTGLRNQHAVENQAIELLERQVGRLENYPEMTDRMRRHIQESREQARRIEDLLSQQATSHSAFKDTVMSFVGNMAALGHTVAPDEVVKNSLANFAFEHYEIASYMSLLTLAELAGHGAAKAALETSLKEEQAMAQWIADHLADTTRRFVERSAANQTAGV